MIVSNGDSRFLLIANNHSRMNEQKQLTSMRGTLSAGQVISLFAGIGSDLTSNGEDIAVTMTSNGICLHLDDGTVEINFIQKGGSI